MTRDQHKQPSIRLESDGAVVRYSPLDVVTVGRAVLPRSMTITVPGPDDLPTVVVDVAIRDGRPVCVGVHVTSDGDDARGVRFDDLARLPLDELVSHAVSTAAESLTTDDGGVVIDERTGDEHERERAARRTVARDTVRGMRSGSHVRGDRLRAIADTWLAHEGRTDITPAQAVMSEHGLTKPTAFRWIARARDAGLLPPSAKSEAVKRARAKRGQS